MFALCLGVRCVTYITNTCFHDGNCGLLFVRSCCRESWKRSALLGGGSQKQFWCGSFLEQFASSSTLVESCFPLHFVPIFVEMNRKMFLTTMCYSMRVFKHGTNDCLIGEEGEVLSYVLSVLMPTVKTLSLHHDDFEPSSTTWRKIMELSWPG